MMVNLIVTGDVHVGKTTAVRKALLRLRQMNCRIAGFVTWPVVDESASRLGITIEDLCSGVRRILARTDQNLGGPGVGPYSFDPEALRWGDQLVLDALDHGCDLLVIDEIGRLELQLDSGFQRTLSTLTRPGLPSTVLVVRQSLLPRLHSRVPQFKAVTLCVDLANRDQAPGLIADALLGPA